MIRIACFAALFAPTSPHALADEGMWLFNRLPERQLQEQYHFAATPEWLELLQRASVRFGNGGSGSFASDRGLVLTNHHVGARMIEKLSTPERDLLQDGFSAASIEEEIPCPDLELNVLMEIEDVTTRVRASFSSAADPATAAALRRAEIAAIERESLARSGLRSDVVTLYQGGAYHLYRYQRYTDVRLVFTPDARAAAFGGDPDNFEFPRYCLDFCFFRAYENGQPARTPHFLRWNPAGAAEGELVSASGHPGRTSRSITYAQLEDLRDNGFPNRMEQIYRTETLLRAWSDREIENARRARSALVGTQNGRKAIAARLNGLLDASFMKRKAESEAAFREALRESPQWQAADAAHDEIAAAERELREIAPRLRMLEGGQAFGSSLFGIARTLVRAADEAGKPDGARLREFQDSGRVSLELGLFSKQPVYADLEILRLADSLTFLCAKLGPADPLVTQILNGRSPEDRARELVGGTQLAEVSRRRELHAGGPDAIAASEDPMIALAVLVDPEARILRERSETLSQRITLAHQQLADARFALQGDTTYPDATFTLRLTFGKVLGYDDPSPVPYQTDFAGLAARNQRQENRPPFDLSPAWLAKADTLVPATPLNFVSTLDITGGNSGSPVVNRQGELVGLIFDSNAPGLISDFAYSGDRGRAVSVHPAGMVESMRRIFGATRVLEELGL